MRTPIALLVLLLPALAAAQDILGGTYTVHPVASGFTEPTGLAWLADGSRLVIEKRGNVWVGDSVAHVFPANPNGNRGLLGVATVADTAFFYYSFYVGGTTFEHRLVRATWSGSTFVDETLIYTLPCGSSASQHNGGPLVIGTDGMLYGVIGDLTKGIEGVPWTKLQNHPNGLPPDDTGIVYRLRPDGTPPDDNPFANVPHMQSVYAYGIRNSFGLAIDPVTGNLWMTENGPNHYDELNLAPPGFNSGWRTLTGPSSRTPVDSLWVAPGSHYRDPQMSWFSTIAPTSVAFYESDLVMGDFVTGALYRWKLDGSRQELETPLDDRVADDDAERDLARWATGFGVVTGLAVRGDTLYVLSFDQGTVHAIAPESQAVEEEQTGDEGNDGRATRRGTPLPPRCGSLLSWRPR